MDRNAAVILAGEYVLVGECVGFVLLETSFSLVLSLTGRLSSSFSPMVVVLGILGLFEERSL